MIETVAISIDKSIFYSIENYLRSIYMSEIKVINGEIHSDARGFISSLNNFRFDDVQRVYFIHHPDTSVVRGWHAHQFEKKWYYCVKGQFSMAFVIIYIW